MWALVLFEPASLLLESCGAQSSWKTFTTKFLKSAADSFFHLASSYCALDSDIGSCIVIITMRSKVMWCEGPKEKPIIQAAATDQRTISRSNTRETSHILRLDRNLPNLKSWIQDNLAATKNVTLVKWRYYTGWRIKLANMYVWYSCPVLNWWYFFGTLLWWYRLSCDHLALHSDTVCLIFFWYCLS